MRQIQERKAQNHFAQLWAGTGKIKAIHCPLKRMGVLEEKKQQLLGTPHQLPL